MSKKLLIALLSIVLVTSCAVTVAVTYFNCSYYLAKTSLSSYKDAKTVTTSLSQTCEGVEINKTVTRYEKNESGYDVTESNVLLSDDPLSEKFFTVTEQKRTVAEISPVTFVMRLIYFDNIKNSSDKEGVFSAGVKQKFVKDFGGLSDGAKNVRIAITYKNERVTEYVITYDFLGDDFTLGVKFEY